MASEKVTKKEKNQNIQVFVRLRPLNQREKDLKSLNIVEVVQNRDIVVRASHHAAPKKFSYDRAFGPQAKQVEVYQEVVSPLIEEVLAGYNCTVFAYGQTGTGKTHTMVGENTCDETTWQDDPLAGIIPRALSQLFDELRISNTEYTVRVSYLELYNEELFDLLSTSEDNSKLRIYEDVTRKGSNIVNGLEEVTVYNKNEVYQILLQGQERKKVASTLMNEQSSRSHTVFTIVVHMKETNSGAEELMKIGKLNLVDLAGSENISKAGSDNPSKRERARECVNINQSLLTLGRVITALVERHPHIPYRESKLTRILQDSLGGRTKTSIIATISPGHKDVEETMSTLDYAYRARNIQNKPEVNQKMTKKAILKEYVEEIDRLKRDLQAARDRNGVYLANDTYYDLIMKDEEQRKEIQELLVKKRAMEEEHDRMEAIFAELNQKVEKTNSENHSLNNALNNTKAVLKNTSQALYTTRVSYEEQRHLVRVQKQTEQKLSEQAKRLVAVADTASNHALALHNNVDKRRMVESTNLEITKTYRDESSQLRDRVAQNTQRYTDTLLQTLNELHSTLDNFTTGNMEIQESVKNKLAVLIQNIGEATAEVKSAVSSECSKISGKSTAGLSEVQRVLAAHGPSVQAAGEALVLAAAECRRRANLLDFKRDVHKFVQEWQGGAVSRVSALQRSVASFAEALRELETRRGDATRRQRDSRHTHAQRRADVLRSRIAEMEADKARMEIFLSKKLDDVESERQEVELRISQWMEYLEERLKVTKRKRQEIEEERKYLEERFSRHIQWYQSQIELDIEELENADKDLEERDCEREVSLKNLNEFSMAFDEGTSAVNNDMKVISTEVVELVGRAHEDLLRTLQEAQLHAEQQTATLIATDMETTKKLSEDTNAVFNEVFYDTEQAFNNVVEKIESNNTSVMKELNGITDSLAEAVKLGDQLTAQNTTLERAQHQTMDFVSTLQQALEQHQQIEGRYLMHEYKVYSPTGQTPSRTEYRYPRVLAATSPHERILARFRAMRENDDDHCVVVESHNESVPFLAESDTESSLSEKSPEPDSTLYKSVSETDVYIRAKNDENTCTDNANYSSSLKKPSRLPAPSIYKKPLQERN